MKIAFKTFGCRSNFVDTEILRHDAQKRGFQLVKDTEVADAYVINSCTVTHGADRDARASARRYRRLNQQALIGMVGCYAQVAHQELSKLDSIDFLIGSSNKQEIFKLFERAAKNRTILKNNVSAPTGFLSQKFSGTDQSRAHIKIQDGCNYKCSFCIIPQARGRSSSLPLQTVMNQVNEASRQGFQEIVLTGIHLAHYGWDQNTDLETLVQTLVALPKGPRVRLSTLDPFELPDSIVRLLGETPRLCPHIHLALQSGNDHILSKMRRIYTTNEFIEITEKIEKQCPDTFIGVDVIVGFPGENEQAFQDTYDVLSNTFWAKLHVFPYSERQGTAATTHQDKVPPTHITQRSKKLRELSENRYQKFLTTQIGKTRPVLIEKALTKNLWSGRTDNFIPTLCSSGTPKQILPLELRNGSSERMLATPRHVF